MSNDSNDVYRDARSSRKFLAIILLCTMCLGFTMIIECPRSFKDELITEMKLRRDPGLFDLLYHLLFWPNILSWFAGFFIDKFLDVRLVTVIYVTVSCVGCTIFTIGSVTKIYLVMIIGRIIAGVGVEAGWICVIVYILKWFPTKLTNTVVALSRTLHLLGGILIFQITNSLKNGLSKSLESKHKFTIIVVIEMGVIVLPLATAVGMALISKPKHSRGNRSLNIIKIKLIDVLHFSSKFWILAFTVNIFFGACLLFLRLNSLVQKYGSTQKQIDMLINSFVIGCCLMGPLIGIIVDWKGRNLTYITVAVLGGVISHFSISFTITDPFYPTLLLSLSYSAMVGSYWPLYKHLVKPSELSTAIGLEHSILMLTCGIGNIVIPRLQRFHSNAVEIYYLSSMLISLVGCCVLWGLTFKNNTFNSSKNRRYNTIPIKSNRINESQRNLNDNQPMLNNKRKITLLPKRINEDNVKGKTSNQAMYLKLKRIEAEGNLYKHQRKRRQRDRNNKINERRRSKSNEELNRL